MQFIKGKMHLSPQQSDILLFASPPDIISHFFANANNNIKSQVISFLCENWLLQKTAFETITRGPPAMTYFRSFFIFVLLLF